MQPLARRTTPGSAALVSVLMLAAVLITACATAPAYRADLPATLDVEGKSLAIIGDLQLSPAIVRLMRRRESNAEDQLRLMDDLRSHIDELGALVVVGDLVFSGRSARDWRHFDALTADFAARMPVLPAIGNHDYPCYFVELCRTSVISHGMLERFPWFVPGQPYSVDAGELLLLFIDSESRLDEQGRWLAEQLAPAPSRYRAALVFFHRPPFTNSIDRGAEGDPDVQAYIVPELMRASLPVVVFNGHVHGLEHIFRDGIHYVTTAGGGGPRGLMGQGADDRYAGPDCPRADGQGFVRPFNYALLRVTASALEVEIRGFCREDASIRSLESLVLPLN